MNTLKISAGILAVLFIIAGIIALSLQPDPEIERTTRPYQSLLDDGLIEYDSSLGDTCPTDARFIHARQATTIECSCPDGYTNDSVRIGGEDCGGSDCGIFEVTCVVDES